jgi:hypothetical protein
MTDQARLRAIGFVLASATAVVTLAALATVMTSMGTL